MIQNFNTFFFFRSCHNFQLIQGGSGEIENGIIRIHKILYRVVVYFSEEKEK